MNKLTQSELRMQMLAGVITESEYKAKLEEVSALMKYASKDAKARDVEQSDREYIATRQKRDKLAKELFNKASYRDLSNVQKDRVNNQLTEDQNEEKDSLNEHYVAGGIVGIGAITQIPSRAKADYEDAFEYFLSQKYSINEEMEKNEIVDFVEKNFDTIKDNFYKSEKEIIMDTDGDEIDLSNLEDQLSTATDAVSLIDVINERSIGGDLDNPEDAQILFDQIKSYASLGEGKEVEEPYNY
jgi:hypothetical protein